MSAKILVIDDDIAFQTMLCEAVEEKGYDVEAAGSAEEGIEKVATGGYDIILLDVRLPGMTGLEAIPHIQSADPDPDIIVMTGYSDKDAALEAIRGGAYDFFSKPFSISEMEVVIKRALEKRRLQKQVKSLKKSLGSADPLNKIIGDTPPMRQVKSMIERVAGLEATVLITGESGTGKELIADTVHAMSPRASNTFVKLNCAAIPEALLESELFGHEKGAFTGATGVKRGKFELAKGGTILLDEIGDMPSHLQPKLLRAVEQKQVERLGGVRPVTYDVRIVAATNQDLLELIKEKTFREDLYYRLNVATIHLPPLRERKDDLPALAEHFLQKVNVKNGTNIGLVSGKAMEKLFAYDWPGNVRQLANVLERAAIFCRGNVIKGSDMDLALTENPRSPASVQADHSKPLKELLQDTERMYIESALKQTGGVQTKAAQLLGITPKNLWNKLKKHDIDPSAVQA